MSDTTTVTPASEPTEVVRYDRTVRLLWAIGEPDSEGYQTYAELCVTHDGNPRYAYRARLCVASRKQEGVMCSEKISFLAKRGLTLDTADAKRFSATKMAGFQAAVLITLRERFAAGDDKVQSFFRT